MNRRALPLTLLALAGCLAARPLLRSLSAQEAPKIPQIVGEWTGTWGEYTPPAPAAASDQPAPKRRRAAPAKLDCKVTMMADGKYEAVFEGECGRPYKYKIPLPGRLVGASVMFSGSVDLGKEDGGVYDWIGRANDKEFVGFYTSQGHAGAFQMARVKKP